MKYSCLFGEHTCIRIEKNTHASITTILVLVLQNILVHVLQKILVLVLRKISVLL